MDALSQSYWCLSNWNLKVWPEERPVLTVPRVRTRRRRRVANARSGGASAGVTENADTPNSD